MKRRLLTCFVGLLLIAGCGAQPTETKIRLGYFPNVTHAQALIGMETGLFAAAVDGQLEPRVFKAGPVAIEALFAGEIDLLYVGPSPAVNGYLRSGGAALRVISGAMSGGAVLVLRNALTFEGAHSLEGLRLASPAYANTQDIALRAYLQEAGVKAEVITVTAADMAALFARNELDGAWVPEPWGARLAREAPVRVVVDERELWQAGQFTTTLLVARAQFLGSHPDLVKRFLTAHVDVTDWMVQHPEEAVQSIQSHLQQLLGKEMATDLLQEALGRMAPTYDPLVQTVLRTATRARALGYLPAEGALNTNLFDLQLLTAVLQERGLPPITQGGDAP